MAAVGVTRSETKIFDAARSTNSFLEIARGRASQRDLDNAAMVYEVVAQRAMEVVRLCKDQETRLRYLDIAINALEASGNGPATQLRRSLANELELRSESRRRMQSDEQAFDWEVFGKKAVIAGKEILEANHSGDPVAFVQEFYAAILEIFETVPMKTEGIRHMSFGGTVAWGAGVGGIPINIGLYSVKLNCVELMSQMELERLLNEIHIQIIEIAREEGCLEFLKPANGAEAVIGLQDTPIEGHLVTFRHNNFYASIDPEGHVDMILKDFPMTAVDEAMYMMEVVADYIKGREIGIALLRKD